MPRLIKITAPLFVIFGLLFSFTKPVHAMCPVGFIGIDDIYHPADHTVGLLSFRNNQQTLVLQPAFEANAQEFGLVLPIPSLPTIDEAPEKIFEELDELTDPFRTTQFRNFGITANSFESSDVTVIEQRDIGDYTATTLTAETSEGLVNWLDTNGYVFDQKDRENFKHYVAQSGYYFVALKVNMNNAELDENGFLLGKLSPISFTFTIDRPMLPFRSMADDMDEMSFTLYTIGNKPYYIPGTEIIFSQKLTATQMDKIPSSSKYAAQGEWLVRSEVVFNPRTVFKDLYLREGNSRLIVENANRSLKIDPHLLQPIDGIVESTNGVIAYIDSEPFEEPAEKVTLTPTPVATTPLPGQKDHTEELLFIKAAIAILAIVELLLWFHRSRKDKD